MAALAGCDSDRLEAPEPSFFRASLRGAVAAEFDGNGRFTVGTPPWGVQTFQITAEQEQDGVLQTFRMRRYDGPPLPPGTYPLTLVHGISETSRGQGAEYLRQSDVQEMYVADMGELVITSSVTGSFYVTRLNAQVIPD